MKLRGFSFGCELEYKLRLEKCIRWFVFKKLAFCTALQFVCVPPKLLRIFSFFYLSYVKHGAYFFSLNIVTHSPASL